MALGGLQFERFFCAWQTPFKTRTNWSELFNMEFKSNIFDLMKSINLAFNKSMSQIICDPGGSSLEGKFVS